MSAPSAAAAASAGAVLAAAPRRLLIAAAQPYQTLAGPALTTHFLHQPRLLPFQRLPFCHSGVAPYYFYVLLQSLAEFAETPRPVRTSLVRQVHAPMEDFWRSVGDLNRFSSTTFLTTAAPLPTAASVAGQWASAAGPRAQPQPQQSQSQQNGVHEASGSFLSSVGSGEDHPVMGAAELCRSAHRARGTGGVCDVRLTLFTADYRPMASLVMHGSDEAETAVLAQRSRVPLPYERPPRAASEYYRQPLFRQSPQASVPCAVGVTESDGNGCSPAQLARAADALFLAEEDDSSGGDGARVLGGLYGEPVRLPHSDGSIAHRACFVRAEQPVDTAGDDGADGSVHAAEVPPWMLHGVVADLCALLYERGELLPTATDGSQPISPALGLCWVCAYECEQLSDVVLNRPVDVVCAAPRLCDGWNARPQPSSGREDPNDAASGLGRVRLPPPWRHRIGLPSPHLLLAAKPSVTGAARAGRDGGSDDRRDGTPLPLVVALKLELRQDGAVALDGVFYCCLA